MSKYQQKIGFRSIKSFDDDDDDDDDDDKNNKQFCNHWSSALQVICHVLIPLRKALIHYYLNHKNKKNPPIPDDKVEWKLLFELGCFFQTMITVTTPTTSTTMTTKENGKNDDNDEDDDEDEENEPPVDPTSLYLAIQAVMNKQRKYKTKSQSHPKDATEAVQLLLELIQSCTRSLPVTSQLWSALLDESGLGAIAKQTIVGKKKDNSGGNFLLQRTMKETRILLCPFPLVPNSNTKYDSIVDGITKTMKHSLTKSEFDWDNTKQNKPDFEVRIPLMWDTTSSKQQDNNDEWNTVKTMQFDTLPNYWFISIQRFVENNTSDDDNDKESLNAVVDIPVTLDVTKYCTSTCQNRQFQLVGGILYDDDNYVAILKNSNIVNNNNKSKTDETITKTTNSSSENDDDDDKGEGDNDDDTEPIEDWNLMESDEVIPMTQEDAVEFLRGGDDGGGGVCGTVLVYKTINEKELKSSDQLLSDIIISHVSGKLDSKVDFYYEEEIIED